jgi:hypothetical protein
MSKIVGVAVALVIVKGGEIIVLYHTLPILRRLWEKVLATGNTAYSVETRTWSFHSAKQTAVNAICDSFRILSQSQETNSLQISARGENEDD